MKKNKFRNRPASIEVYIKRFKDLADFRREQEELKNPKPTQPPTQNKRSVPHSIEIKTPPKQSTSTQATTAESLRKKAQQEAAERRSNDRSTTHASNRSTLQLIGLQFSKP